jgi:hypothetical protein
MTQSALGVIALYTGSGSSGPFALTDVRDSSPILFKENNDITVRIYDPDDEDFPFAPSTLVEATDYTISGAGGTVAGSVTLMNALTTGWTLMMIRREERTQTLDMEFGGALSLETLEAALDKLTRLGQEVAEEVERAFRLDAGIAQYRTTAVVPTPVARGFWQWDDDLRLQFTNVNLLRSGTATPDANLGIDGDFYLDTDDALLYGPKDDGSWGAPISIEGPQGEQGEQGPTGTQILNGTGAPSPATGSDGDFYIDTTGFDIYGPKAAGVWGGGTSLIGPSGPGTGDMNGPSGATDNAIVRFDSTTGKLTQNSSVTISDTGTVAGAQFTSTGLKIGDADSSHLLTLQNNSSMNAARTLGLDIGNADRTFTISADSAIGGTAYVVGGTNVAIGDGGTGADSAAAAFEALKQAATTTVSGVLTTANATEIRASTAGAKAITPADLDAACAEVSLTDAATIAWDWSLGISFHVTLAGNHTLGLPTNGKQGTWRTLRVVGDGVTTRTLNFAAYRGGQGALEDVGASSKEYILSAYCVSSSASAYILKATQANP